MISIKHNLSILFKNNQTYIEINFIISKSNLVALKIDRNTNLIPRNMI